MFTQPSIECGCGYIVQGPNQTDNQAAFEAHDCFEETVPPRWHESVFSAEVMVPLMMIVIVVGVVLVRGSW